MKVFKYKATKYTCLTLACLPAALLALAYVVNFSLDVPVGDQWYDPVHVVIKSHTNQLSIRDLFAMAEGHRPFTIRLIAIAASHANHLDPKVISLTAWLWTWINLILAYILISGDPLFNKVDNKSIKVVAIFVFSWISFTIHDQEGWIDYYFSTWQLALLFFLGACICVQRLRGWLAWTATTLFCALSTLSLGIGLASWIAIPIVAAGYKKHRRLSFLVAWLGTAGVVGWLYQSRFAASAGDANASKFSSIASLASGASENDGSLLTAVSSSIKVVIYSLARLWLPAESSDHSWVPKLIIAFTALAVIAAISICVSFLASGHIRSSSTWAGVGAYSFMGAFLVYLSRRNLMPELRHSAGAQAFWLACASLMILYVANFLANKRDFRSQAEHSYAKALIRGVFAEKFLIPFSIGSIVLLPVLSLAKTVAEFSKAPKFPPSCSHKTKHFALQRESSLRDCFAFIDVRSVYQLSLLSLGGLSVKTIQLPTIQQSGTLITALPGDLLSAYITKALSSEAQQPKQGQQQTKLNIISLSTRDSSVSNAYPSPIATSMDWSGSGKFFNTKHIHASVDAIKEDLASIISHNNPIYVVYTANTIPESDQIKAILGARGMRATQVEHIADSSYPAGGIYIECFMAHATDSFANPSARLIPSPDNSKRCFTNRSN